MALTETFIPGLFGPPSDRDPLAKRLAWTSSDPLRREVVATDRRIKSTDFIRGRLLPWSNRHDFDVLTQIRLIHRAHMRGNEQYILDPFQARRALVEFPHIKGLGGVTRSRSANRPINVAFGGHIFECPNYKYAPGLLEDLSDKAEELFPKRNAHPSINQDSIYYVLSAFQYALALIHPFYEANGRTSEDAMYILWLRRPDLAHTIRFVSKDGQRSGRQVESRLRLINKGAYELVLDIVQNLDINIDEPPEKPAPILHRLKEHLVSHGINPGQIDERYQRFLINYMEFFIQHLGDMTFLTTNPAISALAKNLRRASRTYQFSFPNSDTGSD